MSIPTAAGPPAGDVDDGLVDGLLAGIGRELNRVPVLERLVQKLARCQDHRRSCVLTPAEATEYDQLTALAHQEAEAAAARARDLVGSVLG